MISEDFYVFGNDFSHKTISMCVVLGSRLWTALRVADTLFQYPHMQCGAYVVLLQYPACRRHATNCHYFFPVSSCWISFNFMRASTGVSPLMFRPTIKSLTSNKSGSSKLMKLSW